MSQSERHFSFEFFPAKTETGHRKLLVTARSLASYKPDFFSCTYGVGGSTRGRMLSTMLQLDGEVKVLTASRLSCVGDSKAELRKLSGRYCEAGICNIVTLHDNLPSDMGMASGELRCADELVDFIRTETGGYLHIEVAAYPEVHPQAHGFEDDLANLVRRVKVGTSSAIIQYLLDIGTYFYFIGRVTKPSVDIPVIPGIMLIANYSKLARLSDVCGAELPCWIHK